MKTVKEIKVEELTDIIAAYLPEIRMAGLCVAKGTLSEEEVHNIFETIGQGKYIQDALQLLEETEPMRKSVSYTIVYPGCTSDISFEVVNTQLRCPSPHGYLGHIFTYDTSGNVVRQLTLRNLSLNAH